MFLERYNNNLGTLLNKEQQLELFNKTITVLGCGGNGGYVLEFLARLGVKEIIIFDGDNYDISNLNRQIYCNSNTIS